MASVSSAPSPSGEMTAGVIASGGAWAISGSAPSDASSGRAFSPAALRASMRYASFVPGGTTVPSERAPFQVHAISAPFPPLLATGAPRASSTVSVQLTPPRTRARNTSGAGAPFESVPSPGGVAVASTILGVPSAWAAAAMPSSSG